MKIGIIGGGSIGLLMSYFLSYNHKVTVYVRRAEQKNLLNERGIQLDHLSETRMVHSRLFTELNYEDILLICVKQTHVQDVLPYLNESLPSTHIIFLQNGMSHIPFVKKLPNPLWVGVVEHGAQRINDHSVVHTGEGLIKIAPFRNIKSCSEKKLMKLHTNNFTIIIAREWQQMLHEKLLVNAVINPLTALFRIKNGEIMENEHITYLAKKLCEEAATVLQLSPQKQWEKVQNIIRKTSNNMSSMFVDIQNCVQTEIDGISGYLLQQSLKDMPYTTFIYRSIKALEAMKRTTD